MRGAIKLQASESMSTVDLNELQQFTIALGFLVAVFLGWMAQKSNFCTMGAISDIVNMGDWSRMRMWVLAMGVAMLGFWSMAGLGLIDPARSTYTTHRLLWLSALTGGLLFGFGMVLASGCASKNLLRLGGGSLKALMVVAVMGQSVLAADKLQAMGYTDVHSMVDGFKGWLAHGFSTELPPI